MEERVERRLIEGYERGKSVRGAAKAAGVAPAQAHRLLKGLAITRGKAEAMRVWHRGRHKER